MTVADRIKELRERRGWTQEELAERMGYTTKSSISKIETSGNDITLKKVSKLAKALNTSESYLMGWVKDPDPSYPNTEEGYLEKEVNIYKETRTEEYMGDLQFINRHTFKNDMPLPSYNAEEIVQALILYERYQKAIPQVQAAVETLLKDSQSDA